MNTIRKFYDASESDVSGGGKIEFDSVALTPAAQLAQLGVINNGISSENSYNGFGRSTASEEVEMTDEDDNDLQDSEVTSQRGSNYETSETQEADGSYGEYSLQQVLKQQSPESILRELGYDDAKIGFINELKELDPRMVNFLNVWKTNGDVNGYLNELSIDYSKMPVEEVMRHQLRQEYPKATERQIELLFKKEVIDAYNLDPDIYSEEDVEAGRELLEAKAAKYRDALIEKQQELLIPASPNYSPQGDNHYMETYKENVANNDYTKEVFAKGHISIGEGDNKFTFQVNPNEVTDLLFDSDKWADTLFEKLYYEDGREAVVPNVEHQMLVATVAKYGKSFFDSLAKHYISIGAKRAIDPIENPSRGGETAPAKKESQPTSIAAMMAKMGVVR